MIEAFLIGIARIIPADATASIVIAAFVLFGALVLALAAVGLSCLISGALNAFSKADRDAHGEGEHDHRRDWRK